MDSPKMDESVWCFSIWEESELQVAAMTAVNWVNIAIYSREVALNYTEWTIRVVWYCRKA